MKDSDVISKLIFLAFINPPGEPVPMDGGKPMLTWQDAMGCFARAIEREAMPEPVQFVTAAPGVIETMEEICAKCEADDAAFAAAVEPLREHPDSGPAPSSSFLGKGGREKQDIYNRLRAFRTAYGLGCLQEIAAATGGMVSDDRIRELLNGGKADLEIWRAVGKALDIVAKEKEGANAKS